MALGGPGAGVRRWGGLCSISNQTLTLLRDLELMLLTDSGRTEPPQPHTHSRYGRSLLKLQGSLKALAFPQDKKRKRLCKENCFILYQQGCLSPVLWEEERE